MIKQKTIFFFLNIIIIRSFNVSLNRVVFFHNGHINARFMYLSIVLYTHYYK